MSLITKVRYHKAVATQDMPRVLARLGSTTRLREFVLQLNRAIIDIANGRGVPASPLRPPLTGWQRKRFHSRRSPTQGVNADARLIFRIDDGGQTLYILAVGLRLPGEPDDIYALSGKRLPDD